MYKLAIAALLIAQPAHAHCYSVWSYPWPQHCGGIHARTSKAYYVEITKIPPDSIPLPAVEPVEPTVEPVTPAEADQRTPEQIQDSLDHDRAVAAHKIEINKLMELLHTTAGDQ
jgi:hypothetical protein